jgi:CO/xanthine dehydrogenase FAD-binding subunit
MGAVGPTPIRAPSAENILIGEKPDKNLFEKAGEAATQDSCPISDFRGCDEYRDDMAGVLTKRTLNMAYREIMSRS